VVDEEDFEQREILKLKDQESVEFSVAGLDQIKGYHYYSIWNGDLGRSEKVGKFTKGRKEQVIRNILNKRTQEEMTWFASATVNKTFEAMCQGRAPEEILGITFGLKRDGVGLATKYDLSIVKVGNGNSQLPPTTGATEQASFADFMKKTEVKNKPEGAIPTYLTEEEFEVLKQTVSFKDVDEKLLSEYLGVNGVKKERIGELVKKVLKDGKVVL
jgi:hypothetical protein